MAPQLQEHVAIFLATPCDAKVNIPQFTVDPYKHGLTVLCMERGWGTPRIADFCDEA
jgi:hypothetical protein